MGDNGERLHDWMFAGATETGRRIQDEVFAGAGAVVMGRAKFDVGKPYWDPDPETFHGLPVFVVTHRPGEPLVDPGGSTFTFISEGIEHAFVSAREAAGDRDVIVSGARPSAANSWRPGCSMSCGSTSSTSCLEPAYRFSTPSAADFSSWRRRA